MRLHEFDINIERDILKLEKTTPRKFEASLKNLGFTNVGSGYFASVYALDKGNRVIKVSMIPDPSYEKFLDIALKNTTNPHLPKVYWKVPIKFRDNTSGFIVTLERLDTVTGLIQNAQSFKTVHDELGFSALVLLWASMTIHGVRLFGKRQITTFEREGWLKDITKNKKNILNDKLYITLKKLSDQGPTLGVQQIDIHAANIMLRKKDNTIVITDPWAFES